jgi:hypothetical protein
MQISDPVLPASAPETRAKAANSGAIHPAVRDPSPHDETLRGVQANEKEVLDMLQTDTILGS